MTAGRFRGLPFGFQTERCMQTFLRWIGFGLCHQLPERSFFSGGLQLPVCARDTGIYVGFMVSLAILVLIHRGRRPNLFPPRGVWPLIALMIAVMAFDGVTSYAGWRTTTNQIRLITGLLSGYALAPIVLPMLNWQLWAESDDLPVLGRGRELAMWSAGAAAAYVILADVMPLTGVFYPVLVAVAVLATLTAVNLVFVAMLGAIERRLTRPAQLFAPVALALAVAFGEIALTGAFRAWFSAFVARGA